MNKILATLVLTSLLLVPTIMSAYAGSGSGAATGSVTIAGTCGLALGTSTINYGSVTPGLTPVAASNSLPINNTGTVNALLTVYGGNWTNGSVDQILASNTQFNNHTAAGPFTPLALHSVPVIMSPALHPFPAAHTSSLTSYWQLIPNVLNLGFTGSLTQSLTFSASC